MGLLPERTSNVQDRFVKVSSLQNAKLAFSEPVIVGTGAGTTLSGLGRAHLRNTVTGAAIGTQRNGAESDE